MREQTPTKHISLSMPMTIYEEIKAVADESEISVTKAVNSIIRGYLKAREARRKRDELND